MTYKINIDNTEFEVEVGEIIDGVAQVTVNGKAYEAVIESSTAISQPAAVQATAPKPAPAATCKPVVSKPAASGANTLVAPIPGVILNIAVKVGDSVNEGDMVVIMEAMKMENTLCANVSGVVKEIYVQKGAQVNTGDEILLIG